jgi:hypothetical protein
LARSCLLDLLCRPALRKITAATKGLRGCGLVILIFMFFSSQCVIID